MGSAQANSRDRRPVLLFVTGRLAEKNLRRVLGGLAETSTWESRVQVLPISVAALMTPQWVATHLQVPDEVDQIVLPGFCTGNLEPVRKVTSAEVILGPKDLRHLPEFFGRPQVADDYGQYEIEIIAEINHASRLSIDELLLQAEAYTAAGADVIDVGCEVDGDWEGVGEYVSALREAGYRVSIDTLHSPTIEAATRAGAELVLSVNGQNISAAPDWGAEVVVIPDRTDEWRAMEERFEYLEKRGVPYRADPIIEPIGFGFGRSLERFMQSRQRWPQLPMLMGIGNLTELTEVDSAGINVLLLALCQELRIFSVLTTEVIPWARSSVAECRIARQLAKYAVSHQTPPKHIDSRLVVLRDPQVAEMGEEALSEMAQQIKDFNFRIFAEGGLVHVLGGGHHWKDRDPFELFDAIAAIDPKNLDPSHAFYLGYEMCKAEIALDLGKEYCQDDALNWGHLTRQEPRRDRHIRRRSPRRDSE